MRTQCICCLLLTFLIAGSPSRIFAQGSTFTYQAQLSDGGAPASGIYDLRFTIFELATGGSAVGTTQTNSAVGVTNGLFTVRLDFGPGALNGAQRWLEIGVRTNGGAAFLILSPRHPLTPTPYAITARNITGELRMLTIPEGINDIDLAALIPGSIPLSNRGAPRSRVGSP